MTPGFTTRARADRFAASLDAPHAGTPPGIDPDWLRLVDRLQAVPEVRPRPEFAAALRERLLVAARTAPAATGLVSATPPPDPLDRLRLAPGRPRGQRRLTAAVAGLALVGASGGMAVASQGALPGETLYPVKRAIEDVRTGLEDDPSMKGTRLIGQARDRLTEVAALTVDDGADPVAVEQTLDDFAAQAGEAADLKLEAYYASGSQAEVLEIRGLASDSVAVLGSLEPVVPQTALTALLRAAQDMRALDAAARQACGGCGGPVVDLVPELALDPVSADLGRALGLRELRAAAQPGTAVGTGDEGGDGGTRAGRPDRAATGGGSRPTRGDGRAQRAEQDGRQGGRQDGLPGGGGSVPVDGGSVPELDGPRLRDLTEGVRQGLGELAGSTPLGDLGAGLTGGGNGSGGGSDQGSGGGKADGPKKGGGKTGGGGGAGTGGGLVGEALEDLDDTLGGLVDP